MEKILELENEENKDKALNYFNKFMVGFGILAAIVALVLLIIYASKKWTKTK